jgi:hypothetical protein
MHRRLAADPRPAGDEADRELTERLQRTRDAHRARGRLDLRKTN